MPDDRNDGYVAHVELAEACLRKVEEAFRELAARMQAFAGTDRIATLVLRTVGTTLAPLELR